MSEDLEIIILSSDDESPKASVKMPSQKHSQKEPVTISGNIMHQVKLLCSQSQSQNASQMKTGNSARQQCVSAQNKRITNEISANKCQIIVHNKPHHTSLRNHPKSINNYSGHHTTQIGSSKLVSMKNQQNKKSFVQSVNKIASNKSVYLQSSPKSIPQKRTSPTSFTIARDKLSVGLDNGKNQVSKTDTNVPVSVLNSLQKNGISVSSLQKNGIVVMNVDDYSEDCSIITSQQSAKPSHTPQVFTKQSSVNNSNLKQVLESRSIPDKYNNIIKSNSLCQAKRKHSYSEGIPSKVLCVKKSSVASDSITSVMKNNTLSKVFPVVKPIERTQNLSNVHKVSKYSNTATQRFQVSKIPTQNKLKVYPHNNHTTHSQRSSNIQSQNVYKSQVQNIQKVQLKNNIINSHSLSKNYNQLQNTTTNNNNSHRNQIQSQYKIQFQANSTAQNHSKEKIQKSPEFILPDKIPPQTSPVIIKRTIAPAKRSLTDALVSSSQNKSLKVNIIKNVSQSCSQPKSLSSTVAVKKNDAKENHSRNAKNDTIAQSNTTPFFNPSLSVTVINSDKKPQLSENISKPVTVLVEKKPPLMKNSKDVTATSAVQLSKTVCKKIDLANDRETLLSVLALCEPNGNKHVQPEKSRENDTVVSNKTILASCEPVSNKQVQSEKPKENDVNDLKKYKLSSCTKISVVTKELKCESSIEPLVISLDCENEPFKPIPEKEIDIFSKKTIKLKDVSNLMKNWSKPVVLLNRLNLGEKYLKVKESALKVHSEKYIKNILKPENKFVNESKSAERCENFMKSDLDNKVNSIDNDNSNANLNSFVSTNSDKHPSEKSVTMFDTEPSKYSDINEETCKFSDDTIKDVTLRCSTSIKDSNDLINDHSNIQNLESLNALSTNDILKSNDFSENPKEALEENNELTDDVISNTSEDINNEIISEMVAENKDLLLEDPSNKQSKVCKMKLEKDLVLSVNRASPKSFQPEEKEYVSENKAETEITIPKYVTLRCSISIKDSNDLINDNSNMQNLESLNALSTNDILKSNDFSENPKEALKENNELTDDVISNTSEDINNEIISEMVAGNKDLLLEDPSNKQSKFCKMTLEKDFVVSVNRASPQSFLPEQKEYVSENKAETEITIPKYEFNMENNFDISESASVKNLLHGMKSKAEKLLENKCHGSPNKMNDVSFPCVNDCIVLLHKTDTDNFIFDSKKELMPYEYSDLSLSKNLTEKLNTKETLSLHSNSKLASVDVCSTEIGKKHFSVDNTLEINSLQNNSKHKLPSENTETNNTKQLSASSLLSNSCNVGSGKMNNISKVVTLPKENVTIPPFNLSLLEISNNPSHFVISNCLSQILRKVDALCAKTNPELQNVNLDKDNTQFLQPVDRGKSLFKLASQADNSYSESFADVVTDAKMQLVDCNEDKTQLSPPLTDENKSSLQFENKVENWTSENVNQSACAKNVAEMSQYADCNKDDTLLITSITSLCDENKPSSKLTDQTDIIISKSMSLSECVRGNTEYQQTLSDSNKVTEELHLSQNEKNIDPLTCNTSPSIQRNVSFNENLCQEKNLSNQHVGDSINISESSTNILGKLLEKDDGKIGRNLFELDDQGISSDVEGLRVPDKNSPLFFQEYDGTIIDDCLEIEEDEQETVMLDQVLLDQVTPLPQLSEKEKCSSPVRKQDTEEVIEVIPLLDVSSNETFSSPVRKQDKEKVMGNFLVTSPKLSLKRNRTEFSPNREDVTHMNENGESSSKKSKLEEPTVLDTEPPKEEQEPDSIKSECRNRNKFMELLEFSKIIMDNEKTQEADKNKIIHKMKQHLDSTQRSYVSSEEFASFLQELFKIIREDADKVFHVLAGLKQELKDHKFKSKGAIKANKKTHKNINSRTSVSMSNTVTDDSQSVDSIFSLRSVIPKVNHTFLEQVSDKIKEFSEASAATNSARASPLNNVTNKKFLNNGDEDIHLISSSDDSSSVFPRTNFENQFGSSEIAAKLGLIPTGSVPPKPSDSKSNITETKYDCVKSLDPVTSHHESKFSNFKHDQVEKNEAISFASKFCHTLESQKNSGFNEEKKEKKQDFSPVASTSGYHSSTSENSKPSGVNDDSVKQKHATTSGSACANSKSSDVCEDSVKKNPRTAARIKKLEKYLADLDKRIKKCQKKELSLNDLDNEDSVYIMEEKYKKKFIQVYNKLCEITKAPCRTGRIIEKRFDYEGSRYKAINQAIQKLVNKKKAGEKFPDYTEVYKVVEEVNDEHDMGLSERDIQIESERVFKDVGLILQERRWRDDAELFGCYLTDDLKPEEDPAEQDEELRKTLTENSKKFEKSISELIDKYAEKQKGNAEAGISDKGSEEEEEEEDEGNDEGKDEEPNDKENEEVKDANMDDDLPATNPNSPVLSDGVPADLIQNDISDDDIIILDYSDKSTDPNDDAERAKLEKTVITDPIVIEDSNEDSNESDDLPFPDDIIGR